MQVILSATLSCLYHVLELGDFHMSTDTLGNTFY